jgi:tripartite-type tricarboxylate transporter receptor subunit TctC
MGFAAWCVVAGKHNFGAECRAADSAPGYPARPIRMIVPFPPGGSNDIMGRYFGNYLTERLGRQVVMDNRAGADGIIGTEIVARSQPDELRLSSRPRLTPSTAARASCHAIRSTRSRGSACWDWVRVCCR